jgi:predicted amidohydrolase
LAYVVGVNRIGADAHGLDYSGDSLAIDPRGHLLLDMKDNSAVETQSLSYSDLFDYRDVFPAHFDADNFDMDLSLNLDGAHELI